MRYWSISNEPLLCCYYKLKIEWGHLSHKHNSRRREKDEALASLQYFFFLQLSAFYIPKHGSERRSKPGMSPQDHSLSFLAWQEVSAVMYIWLHHKSLKSLRRENPAYAFISLSEIRYYTCQMLLRISFRFSLYVFISQENCPYFQFPFQLMSITITDNECRVCYFFFQNGMYCLNGISSLIINRMQTYANLLSVLW